MINKNNYLTEEKTLQHLPAAAKFRLSALELNTAVKDGFVRIHYTNGIVLYNFEDCVKHFSKRENKVHFKTICKKSVCERLGISEEEFEKDEEPLTEQELREWAEVHLKD